MIVEYHFPNELAQQHYRRAENVRKHVVTINSTFAPGVGETVKFDGVHYCCISRELIIGTAAGEALIVRLVATGIVDKVLQ